MKYAVMDAAQAAEFSGFVQPHVRGDKDWDKFCFFCAFDEENGLGGLLVLDPKLPRAEVLSVGVSPAVQGQGVAHGLLSFAVEQLMEHNVGEVGISHVAPVGQWDVLDSLFSGCGFEQESESQVFQISVADLLEIPAVKKQAAKKEFPYVVSMEKLSGYILRNFSSQVVNAGLFFPIERREYRQDLSMFRLDGDEVVACFLIRELSPGKLENSWSYLSSKGNHSMALLDAFAAAAVAAADCCPGETLVSFACVTPAGENLLRHLLPGHDAVSLQRSYVRDLNEPPHNERGEERTPPDMQLDLVTIDELVCKNCVHCTEAFDACVKYIRKPGAVLYGGDCKYYTSK